MALILGCLWRASIRGGTTSYEEISSLRVGKETETDSIVISPFTSHPPHHVALVVGDMRHACLQHIRSRHAAVWKEYLGATTKHVLLVDPAYHSNVGDHMITLGELEFLKEIASVSQCSYAQAGNYVPNCDDILTKEYGEEYSATGRKVAVWHGGGNFGDLWPLAQEPRIQSLFPLLRAGYRILTMPNSWYYRKSSTEARDIQRIRDSIVTGLGFSSSTTTTLDRELVEIAKERVIFCWRERLSYERGVEHFPLVTNLLVPDIAFQLGPYKSLPATSDMATDLLLLLRNDHESVYTTYRSRQAFRDILQSVPGASHLTYSIVDWSDRLYRFDSKDIFFTDTSIQLLSLGRIIICDRLHAAILAYLAGLPFIYLDQLSGKITKTLDVAMESDASCHKDTNWRRARNLSHAVSQAVGLLTPDPLTGSTREQRRERLFKKLE